MTDHALRHRRPPGSTREAVLEKQYVVEVLDEQRWRLRDRLAGGTWSARMVNRAPIRLLADAGATDAAMAAALPVGRATVARTRRR